MRSNTFDVVNDSLALISNRQPLDVLAGTGSGTAADVTKSTWSQFGGLQTRSQQPAHDFIREKLHPAIGVMDNEEFPRPQQLVTDYKRADRVVAGAATGVADHMRVSLGKAGVFGGIEPGIHAGKNRKATGRRQSQLSFVSET